MRNFQVRIAEHNDPKQNYEAARHIKQHTTHTFHWKILFKAYGYFKCKIAEGFLIQIHKPSSNK